MIKRIIGNATLYCGDAFEILPTMERPEAIVTDPPYGKKQKSNHKDYFRHTTKLAGDDSLDCYQLIDGASKCLVAFYSPNNPPPIKWRNVLVWNKGLGVGSGGDPKTCWRRDVELIGVNGNAALLGGRDSSVLSFNAHTKPPSGHFCEKPEALMTYLVGKISEQTILDPFMGSGTTGVACANLGRKFIGIEIDEKYFDIACERIEAAYAQGRLFA